MSQFEPPEKQAVQEELIALMAEHGRSHLFWKMDWRLWGSLQDPELIAEMKKKFGFDSEDIQKIWLAIRYAHDRR